MSSMAHTPQLTDAIPAVSANVKPETRERERKNATEHARAKESSPRLEAIAAARQEGYIPYNRKLLVY